MNVRLIEYKSIFNSLYSEIKDIDTSFEDDFKTWTNDFIRSLAFFSQCSSNVIPLSIKNYKAKLPCEAEKINDVSYNNKKLQYTDVNFFGDDVSNDEVIESDERFYSYKLEGNYIITSFKEGTIYIDYDSINIKDGVYLIPNIFEVTEGIKFYIKMKLVEYGISHPVFTWLQLYQLVKEHREKANSKLELPDYNQIKSILVQSERLSSTDNSGGFRDSAEGVENINFN